MSLVTAYQTLYDMVDDMTIDNVTHAFNYDWEKRYDKDKTHGAKPNGKALITIEMGTETNVDDIGALGTGEYFDDIEVVMYATVAFSDADVKAGDIKYYQELAIFKAVDDIKSRYSYPWALASDGIHTMKYTGHEVSDLERADKFTTKRLTCRFIMKYRTNRILLD